MSKKVECVKCEELRLDRDLWKANFERFSCNLEQLRRQKEEFSKKFYASKKHIELLQSVLRERTEPNGKVEVGDMLIKLLTTREDSVSKRPSGWGFQLIKSCLNCETQIPMWSSALICTTKCLVEINKACKEQNGHKSSYDEVDVFYKGRKK